MNRWRWLGTVWMLMLLPGVALASDSHGFSLKVHGFFIVSFVVFLFVAFRYGRGPIVAIFRSRSDAVGQRLENAAGAQKEALERNAEALERESRLDAEKAEMQQSGEEQLRRKLEQMKSQARQEQDRVAVSAQLAVEHEKRRLERELKALVVEEALSKVHGQLVQAAPRMQMGAVDAFVTGLAARNGQQEKS